MPFDDPQAAAALARQQIANGNNPWLASPAVMQYAASAPPPTAPDQPLGSVQFPDREVGPNEHVQGAPISPGALPLSARVARADEERATLQRSLNMERAPQTAGAAPVAAPAMASAKAGTAVGPAKLSPEREALAAMDKVREEERGTYDKEQEALRDQQHILESGRLQADKLAQGAQLEDFMSGVDFRQEQQRIRDEANQRDAQHDEKARLLRQQKVDPNHWFKERGTAGSILAAIAMGAGAFGAAMPHSGNHQNFAMDIINRSIDRDVDAQKDSIEQGWKDLQFEGDQNQKKLAREQYMLQQRQDIRRQSYDHALTMIGMQKQNTQDAARASQLDMLAQSVAREKTKLTEQGIQERLQVAIKERAAAAAASKKAELTPQQIIEHAKKLYEDPNWKAPQGMGREEAALRTAQSFASGGKGSVGASIDKGGPGANKNQENINAAIEVVRGIDRIQQIMADPMLANSAKGRAELDELTRAGSLAYPRMHTGSTRINEAELKAAHEAYSGAGGLIRSDLFGTNKTTLDVIKRQAQSIIEGGGGGNGSAPSSAAEVPGAKPYEE